ESVSGPVGADLSVGCFNADRTQGCFRADARRRAASSVKGRGRSRVGDTSGADGGGATPLAERGPDPTRTGPRVVSEQTPAWSGAVTGSVQFDYDNDFRVSVEKVNAGGPISIQYDLDSLVSQA